MSTDNNQTEQNQEFNRGKRLAGEFGEFDLPGFLWSIISGIVATILYAIGSAISEGASRALKSGEPFNSMSESAKTLAESKMSRINQLTRGTQIIEANIDSIPAKREANIKKIEANRRELAKLYGEVADIIEGDLPNIRRINPSMVGNTKEIVEGFREVSRKVVDRSFPLDPRHPEEHTQSNPLTEGIASQLNSRQSEQSINNTDQIRTRVKAMGLNPDNNIHLAAFSYLTILEQGGDPNEFIRQLPSFQSLEPSQQKEFERDVVNVVQVAMGIGQELNSPSR
jgi:hypothetical protein